MINFNLLKEMRIKIGAIFKFGSKDSKNLNNRSPNYGIQNVADTIHINSSNSDEVKMPYVYMKGTFGGNGHVLDFRSCATYNLSDSFVFIEKIEVLDATLPFDDSLIKTGESMSHSGVNGMSYPSSDNLKQDIKIFFHSRNNEKFLSIQKLKFIKRADGKYNISGIDNPVISKRKSLR